MKPVLFGLFLFILYWLIEYWFHNMTLRKIPTRILVTGTRGKSSITRLIAAGLNSGELKTIAKTTGSAATIIFPDSSEQNINRNGKTSILEQYKVVRIAVKNKTQILVIESMALRPHLQWIESHRLIKPHILIISNIGPDHLDMSGSNLYEIAHSFAKAIPPHGELFTIENQYFPILGKKAVTQDCRIHHIQPAENDQNILYNELPYIEHPENIELALSVCEHMGVDRHTAFGGMKSVTPDIGVLREIKTTVNNFPVTFINAFAANDPSSIEKIYNRYKEKTQKKKFILIVNFRNDRPHRALQISQLLSSNLKADLYIFCGGHIKSIILSKVSKYIKKETILELNKTEKILEYLGKNLDGETIIMGIGNIAGAGIQLTNHFLKMR